MADRPGRHRYGHPDDLADRRRLLDVARAVGVVVEPGSRMVAVDPVVRPRLLLGWLALLTGPGAAVYVTGRDLAGYADVVPDGPVYAAAGVIAAAAAGLFVSALVARRRRCAMATEVLVKVHLDWTQPGHYEPGAARPCRCCGTPTHERDRDGRPCMKGCAEDEIARELLGAARARIVDERVPGPAWRREAIR